MLSSKFSIDGDETEIFLDYMTGYHLAQIRDRRREDWQWFFNEMPIREDFDEQWSWYKKMCNDDSRQIFGIFIGEARDIAMRDGANPLDYSIFCGCVGYKGLNRRYQSAEFGNLVVLPDFQGKGVAKHACALMLRFLFDQVNLQRAYLEVVTHNEKAINLYRRLGFVEEGIMRRSAYSFGEFQDVMIMSMLKEERGKIDEILAELG